MEKLSDLIKFLDLKYESDKEGSYGLEEFMEVAAGMSMSLAIWAGIRLSDDVEFEEAWDMFSEACFLKTSVLKRLPVKEGFVGALKLGLSIMAQFSLIKWNRPSFLKCVVTHENMKKGLIEPNACWMGIRSVLSSELESPERGWARREVVQKESVDGPER